MNFKEQLPQIKVFIFDVDGVLANKKAFITSSGLIRSTDIQDGFAIQHAIKQGYTIAIISGGRDESVRKRYQDLGITDIYLGASYKLEAYEDFIAKYGFKAEEILYMGDDRPDEVVMKIIGLPTCPANAVVEVKAIAKYISDKDGGEGCVRDVIEQVLRSQNKWNV